MGNSQETWNYVKKGISSYLDLVRAELTVLQLSKKAAERCEEARRNFSFEIGAQTSEQLVCADESAVNTMQSCLKVERLGNDFTTYLDSVVVLQLTLVTWSVHHPIVLLPVTAEQFARIASWIEQVS